MVHLSELDDRLFSFLSPSLSLFISLRGPSFRHCLCMRRGATGGQLPAHRSRCHRLSNPRVPPFVTPTSPPPTAARPPTPHQYAKKLYGEAKDCYLALLTLSAQLKRQSPLMKSTSHFFLSLVSSPLPPSSHPPHPIRSASPTLVPCQHSSTTSPRVEPHRRSARLKRTLSARRLSCSAQACSGLAEEELNKDNQEACERLGREAEVHSNLATRVIDYQDEPCPLHMLDQQLLGDYETFSRKPRLDSLILQGRCVVSSSPWCDRFFPFLWSLLPLGVVASYLGPWCDR